MPSHATFSSPTPDRSTVMYCGFESHEVDPLHFAVECGAIDEIQELLEDEDENYDINERNYSGHTPLMVAAMNSNLEEVMRFLLKAKADTNAVGADIDDVDNKGEVSALILAASEGSVAGMKILLDAKAKVNLKCKSRMPTALFHAAGTGSAEKVKLLLDEIGRAHV